jgi:Flp pilus assembly protein TadD
MGTAETAITKAIAMSDRAVYWRFVASLNLAKLEKLAQNTTLSQADRVAGANQYIADARAAAEHAVLLDPTDFENYMATGGVYDALGTFGIGNTFESARAEYSKALALNPRSPRVLFLLGRVTLLGGDRAGAKEYFARALMERPNFIEALSVLSQLELQDQHPENAEVLLKNAITIEPGNFVLRFTLGYLQYSVRDYKSAVESLEAAVILNPVYANAKYFLGLTYARLGRTDDAITQFIGVAELNPDNADVPQIIRNLRAGRDPLEPNIIPPPPSGDVLESGKVPEKAKPLTSTKSTAAKTTTEPKKVESATP